MRRDSRAYWDDHAADVRELRAQLDAMDSIRARIIARDPEQMPSFLEWFERWFLRRAVPIDRETTS